MGITESFEQAVHRHDARLAEIGLEIWVGSEPTFTDRESQTPPWLSTALGGDKDLRAHALLRNLSDLLPGGLLLRSVGRLYPGESSPRWNLGMLRHRNGAVLWRGPPDPMLVKGLSRQSPPDVAALASALGDELKRQGWSAQCIPIADAEVGLTWQVTCKLEHGNEEDLVFFLQTQAFSTDTDADQTRCAVLVLPTFSKVDAFLSVLQSIEQAALASGLQALMFAGATPPVDETLELTTITPDPAVIEVNMAPSRNCGEFLWRSQQVYAASISLKLSPYRLYFNGQVADSGGAGQITYGGPTPETSPFVKYPQLLPGLVRFLNRHPALSYLFAHDFVGGSGQSVRPDERGSDAFDDLVLALALLERQQDIVPELLWKSLASFLCDGVGNSHRAEINIEKLWNPYLPGRGRLGLVEFRSLRMQHTAQRATAIACLFRALLAMLVTRPYTLPLIDWGRELHDRFALPFYLKNDLDSVLAELEEAGVGLGEEICHVLQQNEFRFFGKVDLPFGTLELWRGLEFWPLVGDASSPQQTGSSRTVDASTTRIEVRWMPPTVGMESSKPHGNWLDWGIYVNEICLPAQHEHDSRGALAVFGVRYCSFVPVNGLHPKLVDQTPLTLTLRHPQIEEQYVVKLHEWHPDGLAYPGLPKDLEDARERRSARVTVTKENRPAGCRTKPDTETRQLHPGLTHYSLDIRFCSRLDNSRMPQSISS